MGVTVHTLDGLSAILIFTFVYGSAVAALWRCEWRQAFNCFCFGLLLILIVMVLPRVQPELQSRQTVASSPEGCEQINFGSHVRSFGLCSRRSTKP